MSPARIPSRSVTLVLVVLVLAVTGAYVFVQNLAAQDDSEYQVVELLRRLFNLIKRNYIEIRSLSEDLARATDPAHREEVRQRLIQRLAFVEAKSREYETLMPQLRDTYPRLRPIVASFHRDVARINADIEGIKRRGQLDAPRPSADDPEMAAGTIIVPVTLAVQDPQGTAVAQRRVLFEVAPAAEGRVFAIVDGPGHLVARKVAVTDSAGRATVQVRLDNAAAQPRIRRTVMPGPDETHCKLELLN